MAKRRMPEKDEEEKMDSKTHVLLLASDGMFVLNFHILFSLLGNEKTVLRHI